VSVLTSRAGPADLVNESVRILVVDGFEPFRKSTCSWLNRQPGLIVVGDAMDGLEAIQKSQELNPDLVVLDIGLPKLNGIEVARKIRAVSSEPKILFLTGNDYPQIASEAFAAGADAYVIKLDAQDELLAAVEAVLAGRCYVSKRLARHGLTGYA
jgi:DNA-binding NarL/FixJ family response regulator